MLFLLFYLKRKQLINYYLHFKIILVPQPKVSNSFSRCSTAASYDRNKLNREDDIQSRAHSSRLNRTSRRQKRDVDNVDWNNLGLKIEDWFNTAKTPGYCFFFLIFFKIL